MIRCQFLCAGIALMISFILPLHSQSGTPWKDPSPHAVQFVSVGDGVRLEVIDALKVDKPILVGHSIAGAELSWMANRYPNRVAGVVYLEAGYSYAFDDGKGASVLDMMKLQAPQPPPPSAADLVSFKALQRYDDRVNGFEFPEGELREERQTNPDGTVGNFRDPPGGAMFMKLISGAGKSTLGFQFPPFSFSRIHTAWEAGLSQVPMRPCGPMQRRIALL